MPGRESPRVPSVVATVPRPLELTVSLLPVSVSCVQERSGITCEASEVERVGVWVWLGHADGGRPAARPGASSRPRRRTVSTGGRRRCWRSVQLLAYLCFDDSDTAVLTDPVMSLIWPGLSDDQKRALLLEEYKYLNKMLVASSKNNVEVRKIMAARVKQLVPLMNKPGVVHEPPKRSWDLLTYLPELHTKFGSFDNPPAHYNVARPVPAPAPAPVLAPAPAPPLASQSRVDMLASWAQRLASAAGGAGVHNALAGPSNPLLPNHVPGVGVGMPGGYGAYRDPFLDGMDSDDEGLGLGNIAGGYIPRGSNKIVKNGRELGSVRSQRARL